VDCPWNPWIIHGIRESAWTPQGLPGGVISPPGVDKDVFLLIPIERSIQVRYGELLKDGPL